MAYNRYNRSRSVSASRSRWMELRYAGTCRVCGENIPAGATAYWDAAAKKVTCQAMACCEQDGLTEQVWHGSPVSGTFVASRRATWVGAGFDKGAGVIVTRFNSGAVVTQNARGRCEDAPCCGCCS